MAREAIIQFRLSGKSDECEKEQQKDWTVYSMLSFVKSRTAEYFGDRNTKVLYEDFLQSSLYYPRFYSAVWITEKLQKNVRELVIIGHGETMKSAHNQIKDYIKTLDWDAESRLLFEENNE